MNDLVTIFGGSGFLGRYAVRVLAQRGYRIRVAVRRPNLANYLLPMGHVGQIQLLKTDVTNADAVASALRGASSAINLVGVLREQGRQKFGTLHADAAALIARTAAAEGVRRLVHVSSCGTSEQSSSRYARTKAEGERRAREAFPSATVLRPSLVFGPEDNFFNRFAGLMRALPILPLIGGGRTQFQPVYVGDVAEAIDTCLERSDTPGLTYELGGPKIYTFKELMKLIGREVNRSPWLLGIPYPLAAFQSAILQFLPNPPLTPDQVQLLKTDNVVSVGAHMLTDLGIEPEPLEAILPTYLWRFRREGQFELERVREA